MPEKKITLSTWFVFRVRVVGWIVTWLAIAASTTATGLVAHKHDANPIYLL